MVYVHDVFRQSNESDISDDQHYEPNHNVSQNDYKKFSLDFEAPTKRKRKRQKTREKKEKKKKKKEKKKKKKKKNEEK